MPGDSHHSRLMILQHGSQRSVVRVPNKHRSICRTSRHIRTVVTQRHTRPITSHLEVLVREGPQDGVAVPQVQQLDRVVSNAAQQVLAVFRQVQRRDLPLQLHIAGWRVCAGVPETNLLVKVAADDRGARSICRHNIVATAARELGLDAAVAAQVPDLERAIVTARHRLGVTQELGRHHLRTMTRQRVLWRREREVRKEWRFATLKQSHLQ